MSLELQKRIITSIFLILLLTFMYLYYFVLIISLIIIGIISWIEFYALISKIFKNNNLKEKSLRVLFKSISLLYLSLIVVLILFVKLKKPDYEIIIFYSLLVSIMTDIGGLIVGKILKGKKLTKMSPKKTISGSLGSFIFSLSIIPFFIEHFYNLSLIKLIFFTIIISLISQMGDLFFSFLKRKANVKDTSDLLPGHGGILDRIDGIIFSIPVGYLVLIYF